MEPTIDKAMEVLFSTGAPGSGEEPGQGTGGNTEIDQDTKELIRKASELFDKAKQAQTSGDWAAYGQYLKELEQVLNTLQGGID